MNEDRGLGLIHVCSYKSDCSAHYRYKETRYRNESLWSMFRVKMTACKTKCLLNYKKLFCRHHKVSTARNYRVKMVFKIKHGFFLLMVCKWLTNAWVLQSRLWKFASSLLPLVWWYIYFFQNTSVKIKKSTRKVLNTVFNSYHGINREWRKKQFVRNLPQNFTKKPFLNLLIIVFGNIKFIKKLFNMQKALRDGCKWFYLAPVYLFCQTISKITGSIYIEIKSKK